MDTKEMVWWKNISRKIYLGEDCTAIFEFDYRKDCYLERLEFEIETRSERMKYPN